MGSVVEIIKKEYRFLLDSDFVINQSNEEKGDLYSFVLLESKNGLVFCFFIEKSRLNVSVTTRKILDDAKNKMDKYFDMFYVVKLINPSISFSEINPSIYPKIIRENLWLLLNLFDNVTIKKTIKSINEIMKEYNKVRWKSY